MLLERAHTQHPWGRTGGRLAKAEKFLASVEKMLTYRFFAFSPEQILYLCRLANVPAWRYCVQRFVPPELT